MVTCDVCGINIFAGSMQCPGCGADLSKSQAFKTSTSQTDNSAPASSATIDITAKDGQITEVEISAAGTNYLVEDEITFTGGSGNAKIEVTGVQEQTEWEERDNFLQIPPQVLGINRVFGVKGSNIRSNLFGLEYQLFLNDLYQFGSVEEQKENQEII